jgi:hypothetical protein
MENPQEYYKCYGPMTALGTDAVQFSTLPRDVEALCDVVQGVLIHRDWARAYGVIFSMELLPWDVWGLMPRDDAGLLDERKALLDRVAALTLAGDDAFSEVRAIYQSDDRLRVPPVVFNAVRNAPETITS